MYLREVAGFKAGDRVAIQMPNCLAYPIAVFGTLKAGLVMANTNPLYTSTEMVHQFSDSGAVGLIAIDLFATKVAEVLPKTSIKTVIVVSISDLLPPLKRLLVSAVQKYVKKMVPPITFAHMTMSQRAGAGRRSHRGRRRSQRSTPSRSITTASRRLQYTGGTTGVAKGAVLTHGNLRRQIAAGPRDVEAVSSPWRGSDADRAAAVPHLRVHREPDDLLSRRRTQHPRPEPAAAVELEDGDDAEPITWFTGVNTLFAGLMHEPWFKRTNELDAARHRWPAAWRSCR